MILEAWKAWKLSNGRMNTLRAMLLIYCQIWEFKCDRFKVKSLDPIQGKMVFILKWGPGFLFVSHLPFDSRLSDCEGQEPCHRHSWVQPPTDRERDRVSVTSNLGWVLLSQFPLFCNYFQFLPEASFGHRVLPLPASVCVSMCVSVCVSIACPRDNSGLVQARITKFEAKMQKNLVKVPIILRGNWPWPSRSNLT